MDAVRSWLLKGETNRYPERTVNLRTANESYLVTELVRRFLAALGTDNFVWMFAAIQEDDSTIAWDPKKRRLSVSLKPRSLREALYFQFALAVLGNKSFQLCEGCGKWFELKPGLNRADRLTCSDSCRVKLYRLRRQRARELHDQGRTIKQISKELGSDVSTVKTWINKQKG